MVQTDYEGVKIVVPVDADTVSEGVERIEDVLDELGRSVSVTSASINRGDTERTKKVFMWFDFVADRIVTEDEIQAALADEFNLEGDSVSIRNR